MTFEYFNIYELITAFTAGLFILYLLCFFLKIKRKNILILILNSLTGSIVYFIITIITGNFESFCLNLFICGFSGFFGLLILSIINLIK